MTNVGDVDLTATAAATAAATARTASHAGVEAAAAAARTTIRGAAHAASESAASGAARGTEPRLCLTILLKVSLADPGYTTYGLEKSLTSRT